MSKLVDLSVIVPCYNVEHYVQKTITSIQKNRRKNFNIEIIAINDGSKDKTLDVLTRVKQDTQDNDLIILNKENSGYGATVNLGIKKARGQYISICESDDSVPDDYYFPLFEQISYHDLDVIFHSYYFEERTGLPLCLKQCSSFGNFSILTKDQIAQRLSFGDVGIWLGMYRRSFLIDSSVFLNEANRSYEDLGFIAAILTKARKVAICRTGGHFYRRDVPTQSVSDPKRWPKILGAVSIVESYITPENDDNLNASLRGYCLIHLLHYYNLLKKTEVSNQIHKKVESILSNKVRLTQNTYDKLKKFGFQPSNYELVKLADRASFSNIHSLREVADTEPLSFVLQLAKLKMELFLLLNNNDLGEMMDDLAFILTIRTDLSESLINQMNKVIDHVGYSTLVKYPYVFVPWLLLLRKKNKINDLTSYISLPQYISIFSQYEDICLFQEFRDNDLYLKEIMMYDKIREDRLYFEKYCSEHSLSIVGNAPNELGKGRGGDVDNFDSVIRFNNYKITDEFAKDYGRKEGIWCISPAFSTIVPRNSIANYDFVVTCNNDNRYFDEKRAIIRTLQAANVKFVVIDVEELLPLIDIRTPTLGAVVLSYLQNVCGPLENNQIYGFSLLDNNVNNKHYFVGDPQDGQKLSFHQWNRESFSLRRILNFSENRE